MGKIIKNLEKTAPDEEIMEGEFKSLIFKGEDDTDLLSVYIENISQLENAEKCVEHFNNMPGNMIDEICHKLLECCHLAEEDYELPELENIGDILNYCWFSSISVASDSGITYVVEGEGDWGEAVGFVIENGNLSYVGDDFFNYL